jgi:multicomponent Na+:H+ antiporter subunit E
MSTSGSHLDRAGVLRRWPTVLAVIAMWIALWERLSLANVLAGAVVAWAVLLVARDVAPRPVQHFRIIPALRYLLTFVEQLVAASWQVALAVVRPDTITPGIIAMPLRYASDAVVTLVANSITLTPGTLTLETERQGDTAILYVHAIDLSDIDAVRDDIRELERLAVDAFGGADTPVAQDSPGSMVDGRYGEVRDTGSDAARSGRRDEGKELR